MVRLENEFLKIEIKKFGAEMVSVYNKEIEREVLWHGEADHWGQSSPHLFPTVGKVFNNQYKADGETYELKQHGFLREQMFDVLESSDDKAIFRFDPNDSMLSVYPYKHAVEVTYTLKGKRLEVKWDVYNLDDKVMFYSIGAHPGFVIDKSHDYVVEYELDGNPTQQVILDQGFIKELVNVEIKPLVINEDTFINDAVIYTGVEAVTLVDQTSGYRIRCDFKGFEYIAVWSSLRTGSMSPFVCLEPWRGIVDDLGGNVDISQKRGIQSIAVGAVDTNRYGLEF